ncbi:DUF5999 family protein [Sphaerisporangium sp. NPDC051011]|uniref:DUF5999 family protein n=1 Tax=Sphaerisporangium sp. NPDC051011 TaxID=3155792 RepID=UPI0033D38CBC
MAFHPEQGWSLLCNGDVVFDGTGELLPDGRVVDHRVDLMQQPMKPLRLNQGPIGRENLRCARSVSRSGGRAGSAPPTSTCARRQVARFRTDPGRGSPID